MKPDTNNAVLKVKSYIKNAVRALSNAANDKTVLMSSLNEADKLLCNAKVEVDQISGQCSLNLRKAILTLKRSIENIKNCQNTRTQNNDRVGLKEMRKGDVYKPPVDDGLKISRNERKPTHYKITNYRKVQNSDGFVEIIIDTQDGMQPIDGKELATVIAAATEKSTGAASAIKATDITPMDASSPITAIVDIPEANVQIVSGPSHYVGETHSLTPLTSLVYDTADIAAVVPESTTPESVNPVQAEETIIATNQRTNNSVIQDVLDTYHSQNTVDLNQELQNMLMYNNFPTDPFANIEWGKNLSTVFED